MDKLQALSPEQIKALSPECLQVILNSDTKSTDIVKLKYYFTISNGKCDANLIKSIQDILFTYSTIKFYITYKEKQTFKFFNECESFELHTEEDITNILPTGIDIHKICFSKDSKPFYGAVTYPEVNKTGIFNTIDLVNFHDNLYVVHPHLLAMAKYFYE